ncbi:MAG: AmmeMemoRadiSam system protein A [Nitrospirota bacterium]|nr:AmmeMemoRadiSam system protein A [Nitrospirota bacterium]
MESRGQILLSLARDTIARELGLSHDGGAREAWLREPGAVFVTLKERGDLRGCMGTLEAYRPLADDVRSNALAAAFRDPRFPPLRAGELDLVQVEVSELSPLTEIHFTCEAEAAAHLRPGIDGVVLRWGERRGTFLPQVWEHYPAATDFLRGLKRKAGLSAAFWDPAVRLFRYTVIRHTDPIPSLVA